MTIPLYNLTDTWVDGGITYTAIKMNATNTASAAGSLLLDLQVGGTSKFNVNEDGAVSINTTNSTLTRGVLINQFFQGDVTNPLFRGANLINFGDMSNVTPAGANINCLHIQHQYFGGPNCAGSHQGLGVEIHHQGGLGPTPVTDTSFPGVQGATITAGSDQSWGGVFPTPKGQVYGMQVFGNADNSGYLDHVHAMEIDVGISGGTTARLKSILDLLLQDSNTAQAIEIDAAIVIGTSGVLADPTKAFRDGILFFQNAAGGWTPPCSSSNGTFIRCENTHNLVDGINFEDATFSGSFLKSVGFQVNGSGSTSIGGTTLFPSLDGLTPQLEIDAVGTNALQQSNNTWSNSQFDGANIVICRSRGTTIGTQAIVQANDLLGQVIFNGSDGNFFRGAASIAGWVDNATPGAGVMPGLIEIRTTDSSGTGGVRLACDSKGNVVVNTAAIATNATDGFLYVPTCAGVPTGTPSTKAGCASIVVDTTDNRLYFYSTGAWRNAGP